MEYSKGKIESINDIEMYYEIHGQGEPLLLLHGFTGSSADWGGIRDALSNDFQLIIPDMRGHGRSTHTNSQFTFRQVAADMYALLDKLKIYECKGLGCSGGGNALLHMATQQPDRITSMVLVSATSHYPEQARAIMAQVSIDTLNEEQWNNLRNLHKHGDSQIRALYKYVNDFACDENDMKFTSETLASIKASTLIVQGDRDFLYPVQISVDMYQTIPNSSLWIIPNAGHVQLSEDVLPYFISTSKRFLTNKESSR